MIGMLAAAALAQLATAPAFVPLPQSVEMKEGRFVVPTSITIVAPRSAEALARDFAAQMAPVLGASPKVALGGRGALRLSLVSAGADRLGPEGYRLRVGPQGIEVVAERPAGLFYGLQTLRQAMPGSVFGRKPAEGPISVPCLEVVDRPRFAWRGAHMDVGRHFQPKSFILKFLDLMSMHKLNVFHWHLTEDQGWRLEIKRYPRLVEVGSRRKDTMLSYNPARYSGQPHEGHYTQEDVREIVAYAGRRFITIVPEIEMPGHAQAAIAAYPELGNGQLVEVMTQWGVSENVFNVKDSTIEFLQNVLAEAIDLFPGPFIHIGGDECPKTQWKASAFAQAKIKALGLKDEHELQSWFIRQMDAFLAARGRRLIGWSEILEGGLAPGAALMVWLGDEGALQAVSSGHDVVMAQTTHTYFDYYQSQNRAAEPHAIGGFLPLEKVYAYDPILPKMSKEQARHVLGTQFQLWSEYIATPSHMEYMAFPRACALAEVAWTETRRKDWAGFSARLPDHLARLDAMGVNYRRLDRAPVGID